MKILYLLRHAKAEAGGKDTDDKDRVLAPRGHEACAAMGAYMREKRYVPALVLCSSAARTRETLERVAEAAGMKPKARFEDALYLATAEEILREVRQANDAAASVMVVGHNPGMHHTSLLLSSPKHTELRQVLEMKYPTCALAVLRFDILHWKDVKPGAGVIADFITPGEL